MGKFIDKRIYLDSDFKLADKRRVQREKGRWKEKYFPEDSPDSFAGGFSLNYRIYIELYNPKEKANLVVKV